MKIGSKITNKNPIVDIRHNMSAFCVTTPDEIMLEIEMFASGKNITLIISQRDCHIIKIR